jgi:acetolactate synthase-1/2/3 large subunit
MPARRVYKEEEVDEAIEWAMSINDRPVLIDFRVSKDAMVWPMVAAGVSNDEMKYARGIAPEWEQDV